MKVFGCRGIWEVDTIFANLLSCSSTHFTFSRTDCPTLRFKMISKHPDFPHNKLFSVVTDESLEQLQQKISKVSIPFFPHSFATPPLQDVATPPASLLNLHLRHRSIVFWLLTWNHNDCNTIFPTDIQTCPKLTWNRRTKITENFCVSTVYHPRKLCSTCVSTKIYWKLEEKKVHGDIFLGRWKRL